MAADEGVTPAWLAKQIETGDPDLLLSMVKTMVGTSMSAEADGQRRRGSDGHRAGLACRRLRDVHGGLAASTASRSMRWPRP
ncbi:hypothetical protein GCM10022419_119860 [Nonomuraea rosea]|uniref:Uncharacterized protein n=1 Tax=Nonomuraea rosea TaxID=638574 RepID=A0ABP6ZNZ2_9ACTN